jgi:8-oxo-dGTP pyrophosphatase MutT (NUDIX family)
MNDKQPVPAKPAATTILVREGIAKPEILMVKRHADTSFGSMYAFPGGVVSDADHDGAVASKDWGDAEASAHLDLDEGGLNYYSAAMRELFEETGVLLAEGDSANDPTTISNLRQKYSAGDLSWQDIWQQPGLSPDTGALHYASYWETPLVIPYRFSARFFIAIMPPGQEAIHDGTELTDSRWLSAEDMLQSVREKATRVAFVTGTHLGYLRDLPDIPGLIDWARQQQNEGINKIRPFILKEDGKKRFLLPGDEGYPE